MTLICHADMLNNQLWEPSPQSLQSPKYYSGAMLAFPPNFILHENETLSCAGMLIVIKIKIFRVAVICIVCICMVCCICVGEYDISIHMSNACIPQIPTDNKITIHFHYQSVFSLQRKISGEIIFPPGLKKFDVIIFFFLNAFSAMLCRPCLGRDIPLCSGM